LETFEKKWPYMYDQTFQLKWDLISGIILEFGQSFPLRILDLGCGPINFFGYADSDDFYNRKYIGIDNDKQIIDCLKKEFKSDCENGNCIFIHADYHKLDVGEIEGKFNVLLWTGIPDGFDKYNAILKKYLPLIDKGGIVIFDYQATSPVGISKWINKDLPMQHVTGCELKLPYLSKSKFPNHKAVNHRIIEVFKKT